MHGGSRSTPPGRRPSSVQTVVTAAAAVAEKEKAESYRINHWLTISALPHYGITLSACGLLLLLLLLLLWRLCYLCLLWLVTVGGEDERWPRLHPVPTGVIAAAAGAAVCCSMRSREPKRTEREHANTGLNNRQHDADDCDYF